MKLLSQDLAGVLFSCFSRNWVHLQDANSCHRVCSLDAR